MGRRWTAVACGIALALGSAGQASAGETWCDVDPPVVLTTPGGNTVVVYVDNSGPVQHLASLLHPAITANVQPSEGGSATLVQLTVTIPDDLLGSHYAVASQAWSGAAETGRLYADRSGYSDQPLLLQFKLNVP